MFDDMDGLEIIFTVCAVAGGILFVARTLLMFMGGIHGGDAGGGADAGGDVGHDFGGHGAGQGADAAGGHSGGAAAAQQGDTAHESPEHVFKALSLHGITAFLLMFGLVGRALFLQSGFGESVSIAGALIAGCAAVWLIGRIFRLFFVLQSSGTLDLREAIGRECTVYLTIKPGDVGKVQVEVQGRLVTCDAVSEGRESIATGDRVWVTRMAGPSLLGVEKQI